MIHKILHTDATEEEEEEDIRGVVVAAALAVILAAAYPDDQLIPSLRILRFLPETSTFKRPRTIQTRTISCM